MEPTSIFFILINRDGLHRVLLNLFLNAIQAMPGKGRIDISSNITNLAEGNKGKKPYLHLLINDTGTGMDPRQLKDIFKPFQSSKPGGTGLGLSICKEIISASSGTIRVESHQGKGTSVHIYLPLVS